MFEEEAERYIKTHNDYSVFALDDADLMQIFKDGAKFGFQKGKKEFEDVKFLLEDMEKKKQAFYNAINLLVVKAQPYLPIEVSAEYLPGDGACFAFDLGNVPMLLPMDITFDAIKRGEPITEDFMIRNSI